MHCSQAEKFSHRVAHKVNPESGASESNAAAFPANLSRVGLGARHGRLRAAHPRRALGVGLLHTRGDARARAGDRGLQLRRHVDVLGDVVDELLGPEDLRGNGRFVDNETRGLTLANFISRKTLSSLIAEACLDLINVLLRLLLLCWKIKAF